MKTAFLTAVILCLSFSTQAGPWHYVKTHKELLINDTLVTFAWSADAASSIHCQNSNPYCVEQSPLLGRHPTAAKTWGTAISFDIGMVSINHAIWHFARGSSNRHLIWITGPFIGIEADNVKANVEASN